MFLVAIGFLLIAVSPQLPMPMAYVIMGLVMVLAGVVRLKNKHKKNK